jgi:hypothetical protein
MRPTPSIAALIVLGAVLFALPTTASAERRRVAQGDDAARAALVAERVRVRVELERANADVDALKRSGRGLRDDYRLRDRLADAEALARRLTELDRRLGGAAPSAAGAPTSEPRVSAADGPAEIDAKADILADQAQRLAARGEQLLGRARDLRARQTLRRRVGQMERDPFSPLEGSKRRAMTGSVANSPAGGLAINKVPPTAPVAMGTGADVTTGPPTGGATVNGNVNPGRGDTPTLTASPAPNVGTAVASGAGQPPAQQAPAAPGSAAVSATTSAPTPTSTPDATALSVQLRDLLDPTTLAEIQRLEMTGGAAMSTEALERAGAALKARAERLRQQAAALRASEHAPPSAR